MDFVSINKINKYIASVEWSEEAIHESLENSELIMLEMLASYTENKLFSISFSCIVPFSANEVPGIIAPFNCYAEIKITRAIDTGIFKMKFFIGPKEMRGGDNYETSYNVEWL